ncbi:MAG: hypothetical protein OEO21_02745 [Candidatus Krumholzibacteria bacterium]|nr:hypothetical protein [Candidatus Krumholzibacteria bacterium]
MPEQELTPAQVRRAQETVARIQGVSSCQIVTDGRGEITEVHVVATSGKPPKLVARDVESCLKAELGIDVDYKKIGVVLFAPDGSQGATEPAAAAMEEFPVEEHASRFAFHCVNVFVSREGTRAEVELARDGVQAFGASSSDNPAANAWEIVAEATLRAISELLDASTRLCLVGVLKIALGDASAAVVRVDTVGSRSTKSLAGCSIIGGNENQTVVFATLDAVNRIIGKLNFKSSIEYRIR